MNKLYLTILIIALILSILGCTQKHNDELTQKQIEQIKSEVKVEIDSLIVKWANLDGEGCLEYYSTDMHRVGSSSLLDFQVERRLWEGIKNTASTKIEPIYEDFMVLKKDLAISAWVGKITLVRKSGDTLQINKQTYTNVWKKNNGQWKIIYEHASSFD